MGEWISRGLATAAVAAVGLVTASAAAAQTTSDVVGTYEVTIQSTGALCPEGNAATLDVLSTTESTVTMVLGGGEGTLAFSPTDLSFSGDYGGGTTIEGRFTLSPTRASVRMDIVWAGYDCHSVLTGSRPIESTAPAPTEPGETVPPTGEGEPSEGGSNTAAGVIAGVVLLAGGTAVVLKVRGKKKLPAGSTASATPGEPQYQEWVPPAPPPPVPVDEQTASVMPPGPDDPPVSKPVVFPIGTKPSQLPSITDIKKLELTPGQAELINWFASGGEVLPPDVEPSAPSSAQQPPSVEPPAPPTTQAPSPPPPPPVQETAAPTAPPEPPEPPKPRKPKDAPWTRDQALGAAVGAVGAVLMLVPGVNVGVGGAVAAGGFLIYKFGRPDRLNLQKNELVDATREMVRNEITAATNQRQMAINAGMRGLDPADRAVFQDPNQIKDGGLTGAIAEQKRRIDILQAEEGIGQDPGQKAVKGRAAINAEIFRREKIVNESDD